MKPQKETTIKIEKLTGAPGPTDVSKVAMGGDPETLMQHNEDYQDEMVGRLMQGPKGPKGPNGPIGQKPNCEPIEEAYANLFEGLSGIFRHLEEGKEPEPQDDTEEEVVD